MRLGLPSGEANANEVRLRLAARLRLRRRLRLRLSEVRHTRKESLVRVNPKLQ